MPSHVEKTFCRGAVIIKEGQPGSTFYVILDGMVEVIKRRGGKDVVVGVLGPSEFFGEMSLIGEEDGKRSATVRAVEETRVAIMSREDFDKYLGRLSPGVRKLLSRLSERLKRTSALVEEGVFGKDEEAGDDTLDFAMTLDELERARDHAVDVNFMSKKFLKGQVVIREGQKGQCGFIVKSGRLEVSRVADDGERVVLGELADGDILGESAMFENITRSATVKALTDGEVMVFGKRDMLQMARQSPLELFMIIDSLSGKIDRTSEEYCRTLLELDRTRDERDSLRRDARELKDRVERLEADKRKLSASLETLEARLRKQTPPAGDHV